MRSQTLTWKRFYSVKAELIAILVVLIILYIVCFKDPKTITSLPKPHKKYHADMRSNIFFDVQQEGDYWIWYNYLKADYVVCDNDSITLTTHGTYADLNKLFMLIPRWSGPISLSLLVNGYDFTKAIKMLNYVYRCTKASYEFRRYVTLNLVFEQAHFPDDLLNSNIDNLFKAYECPKGPPFENVQQNETYWYTNKLEYPVNLLRNVARLNSNTYYVLPIDISLLPIRGFIKKFLQFVKEINIKNPMKSVFCMTIVPEIIDAPIPVTKSELRYALKNFARVPADKSIPFYQNVSQLNSWLNYNSGDDFIKIYEKTKDSTRCNAYVSINSLDPFFDRRLGYESIYDLYSIKLQLLMALNYDFIILDEAFIVRRLNDSWENINIRNTLSSNQQSEIVKQLAMINEFNQIH